MSSSSGNKFWRPFGRRSKSKKASRGSSTSPPDRLPYDIEDAEPPDASATSSMSSTVNSNGFYSTPPSHSVDDKSPSPLSISPSTPRKDWEVNYKTYLSGLGLGDDKSGGDISSDGSQNFAALRVPFQQMPDLQKSSEESLVKSLPPTASNTIHHPKPYRVHSDPPRSLRSAHGNLIGPSAGSGVPASLPSPRHSIDNFDKKSIKFKNATTSTPPTSSSLEMKATGFDEPIHGGNIFKNLRKKNKERKASGPITSKPGKLGSTRNKPTSASADNMKKRTQSCGSLDIALRNGAEVATSVGGGDVFRPGTAWSGLLRPRSSHRDYGYSKRDKRRQQKLAFTEYHNSHKYAADNAAPYLGEEKSVQRGSNFAKINSTVEAQKAKEAAKLKAEALRGSLSTVTEVRKDLSSINTSKVSLCPVQDTDDWVEKGRYLMAPAIMATCQEKVFSLSVAEVEDGNPALTSHSNENRMFGQVPLGSAAVGQIVPKLVVEEYEWSTGNFVLRQNYLLEYEVSEKPVSRPRGFAFLQNASIRRHEHLLDSIRLEFCPYQNYSASSERKSVVIKLNSEKERERWFFCLTEAARLKPEDLYEYDAYGKVLGRGRFATIYPGRRRQGLRTNSSLRPLGKNSNASGILKKNPSFTSLANVTSHLTEEDYECALKVIDKDMFWDRVNKDRERADSIVRETSVQAALMASEDIYPGFLRVKSFFETLDKVILELELLDGIDLFRYISSEQSLSEKQAAEIMYDILSCLDVMKKNGIAHRDIKPANILMADKGKSSGVHVKLGDFGMATFVGADNLIRGRCGTPGYVAPEIMTAKKNGGYQNNVDMFSAGVIMYILLCGYEPFYGETEKELIAENSKAKVEYPKDDWNSVSVEGRDLVERMLERDPLKRIEPSKALQHAWIRRRTSPRKVPTEIPNPAESPSDFACSIS